MDNNYERKSKGNRRQSIIAINRRFLRMLAFTSVEVIFALLRSIMNTLSVTISMSSPYIREIEKPMHLHISSSEEDDEPRKAELCNNHPLLIGELIEVTMNLDLDPIELMLALHFVLHQRQFEVIRSLHTSEWLQPQMVLVPFPRAIEYNLQILQRYMDEFFIVDETPNQQADDQNDKKRQ